MICVAIASLVDKVSLQFEELNYEAKLPCKNSVTRTKFTMKHSRIVVEDGTIIILVGYVMDLCVGVERTDSTEWSITFSNP